MSKQLTAKYGIEFAQQARSNKINMVSDKVITKLGVEPPSHQMVDSYMAIIAENYNVPYERDPTAAFVSYWKVCDNSRACVNHGTAGYCLNHIFTFFGIIV